MAKKAKQGAKFEISTQAKILFLVLLVIAIAAAWLFAPGGESKLPETKPVDAREYLPGRK